MRKVEEIEKEFEKFGSRGEAYREDVELFLKLCIVGNAIEREKLGTFKLPSAADVESTHAPDFPLVRRGMLDINPKEMRSFFLKLMKVIEEHNIKEKASLKKMENWISGSKFNAENLVWAVFESNRNLFASVSKENEIDEELLVWLAENATRAFIEPWAEKLKSAVKDELWMQGICPVCGNRPRMAKLEKETGQRTLWCALCNFTWKAKRICCPSCGTEDQKKLRFFFRDENEPFRIDVCNKCGCYIKTIDERKLKDDWRVMLDVADIVTQDLDAVAREKGYHRYLNPVRKQNDEASAIPALTTGHSNGVNQKG